MDYLKQANDFCNKHSITIKCEKPVLKRHFAGDKEERYVWQVTIHRTVKGQKMSFEFGNSINAKNKMPSNYDILTCLTKYDPGTFSDFCSDYGFDTDSRRAEKTYNAVCKEFAAVQRLFGDILDEMQEIQ